MRAAWVTRSFLDYRIPVFAELDRLLDGGLRLVFSADYVPQRVVAKAREALGARAVALAGEWRMGPEDRHGMANAGVSLRFHPGVAAAIRRARPDVLICDGFFKWTVPALWWRITRGTPLVICYERTFHTERNAQWFRTAYRRVAIRWTAAMCCNGRLCAEYATWLGMSPKRITTGQMAADTDGLQHAVGKVRTAERRAFRTKWAAQGTLVLYVGSLSERKGVRQLLSGWAGVQRARPNRATLLLVGQGDQEAALRELCRERALRGVRFAGAVDYDAIAPFYAAADAFVIPTLEDNWSLVVPEAMACGLPMLCSKYNGCWPELVHEGVNGWVFDPLDRTELTRKLLECIDRRAELPAMGERSREIIGRHTPRKAAESILAACEMAVGNG